MSRSDSPTTRRASLAIGAVCVLAGAASVMLLVLLDLRATIGIALMSALVVGLLLRLSHSRTQLHDARAELDRSHQSLQLAETRVRTIATLTDGYCYEVRLQPNGTIANDWVSDSFAAVTGYSAAELEARGGWATIVFPADLPLVAERAKRVLSGEPDVTTFRIVTRGGEIRWMRDDARPVRDPISGRATHIVGTAHDDTEPYQQRRTTQATLITNLRLMRALDAASDGIVICDAQHPDQAVIYVNETFTKMTGYTAAEVIGRNCRFLQGEGTDRAAVDRIRSSLRHGHPVDVTLRNYRADGEPFWNRLKLAPVHDDDGALIAYIGVQTDVTAQIAAEANLRESESKLRLITDQLPSVLWTTDHTLTITSVHGNLAADLVPDPQAFLGASIDVIFAGQAVCDAVVGAHRSALDGKSGSYQIHIQGRDFAVRVEALRDSKGAIIGALSLAVDRSDMLRTEQLLRRSAERSALQNELIQQASSVGLNVCAVVKTVVRHVGAAVADGCLVWLASDDRSHMSLASLWHAVPEREAQLRALLSPESLSAGQGLARYVMERGETLLIDDIVGDAARFGMQMPEQMARAGLGSLIVAPLIAHGGAIGTLTLIRDSQNPPLTEADRELTIELAAQAALAIANAQHYASAQRRLTFIEGLHVVDRAVAASTSIDVTYGVVLSQLINSLGLDAAAVLRLDAQTNQLVCTADIGLHGAALRQTRVALDERLTGMLEQTAVTTDDLRQYPNAPRRAALIGDGFAMYATAPIEAHGQLFGVLEGFSRRPLATDDEWRATLSALAGQLAIGIETSQMIRSLQRARHDLAAAYDATIEGWSRALDLRDKETEGHSQRVTGMALLIAAQLGLDEAELIHVRRGALLHDIGKMGVPDAILLKPGALTADEQVIMRQHPQHAYDLLSQIDYLRPALDIPYAHHEKWDGTGYPRGLRAATIPLAARIFAVADVWDALRSDRPYRLGWSDDRVRQHIRDAAGTHFDPAVVAAFLTIESELASEQIALSAQL